MQKELNCANMEQNAIEALSELQWTLDRIRFRQGLPPHRGWADKRMAFNSRRRPLSERGLEISFEEALHHLNWSWNERHLTDAEIRNKSTPYETIDRPKLRVSADESMATIPHRLRRPALSDSYLRYVRKWQDKRLKTIDNESPARLVARAISMHPLFSLSQNVQTKFSGPFYPDFAARKNYCREKRDGWRDLRWTLGDALREAAYWRACCASDMPDQALETKDAHAFCLKLSVLGQRLAMKHIRMMVEGGRFELLEDLFRKIPRSWKLISPRELLLWVCADGRFKDANAARLVKMLEEKRPGIVAQTVDVFGDTPLWHTLYRYQYGGHVRSGGWREESENLCKTLRRFGCDPRAVNKLGLSWSDVKTELRKLR